MILNQRKTPKIVGWPFEETQNELKIIGPYMIVNSSPSGQLVEKESSEKLQKIHREKLQQV